MSRQLIADIYAPRERASATVQGNTSGQGPQPRRSPMASPAPSDAGITRSLAEQQRLFAAAVMTPEHAPSYLDEAAAASLLTTGPTLSALERLEIYRNGYHARLVECLQDDYPALQHALGEAKFVELCHRYIARHPSDGPSLNVYGRHMAAFCLASESTANGAAAEPESGAAEAQFHSELAALEWAIVQTIHAPSGTSLRPEDLASIPAEAWPEVKLVLNPSLSVLQSRFPINSCFQAFRNGEAPVAPAEEPSVLAIYRTGRSVWRLPLSAAMGQLLADLKRGTPLAAATEAVTSQLTESSEAEAANTVTRWFASAVSSGLFGGVSY